MSEGSKLQPETEPPNAKRPIGLLGMLHIDDMLENSVKAIFGIESDTCGKVTLECR